MDRFTRKFQNTPSGTKKNWKTIPAEQIDVDFVEAKEYIMKIFDQGKTSEFPGFELDESPIRMLTDEEALDMGTRIEDEMNASLDAARNAQLGLGGLGNIPPWCWGVVLLLGRNDIMNFIFNPFLMFPIIIFIAVIVYLASTGKLGVIKTTVLFLIKQQFPALRPYLENMGGGAREAGNQRERRRS